MGYSSELFLSAVDPVFKCIICHDIVEDPVSCTQCQVLFCSKCCEELKKTMHQCPQCRSSFFQTQKIGKLVQQIHDRLQVKCPHECCKKVIALERLQIHLSMECQYLKVLCQNCNLLIYKSELKQHANVCEYWINTCEKCKAQYKNAQVHDCIPVLLIQITELKSKQESLEEKVKQLEKTLECFTQIVLENIQNTTQQRHYNSSECYSDNDQKSLSPRDKKSGKSTPKQGQLQAFIITNTNRLHQIKENQEGEEEKQNGGNIESNYDKVIINQPFDEVFDIDSPENIEIENE